MAERTWSEMIGTVILSDRVAKELLEKIDGMGGQLKLVKDRVDAMSDAQTEQNRKIDAILRAVQEGGFDAHQYQD